MDTGWFRTASRRGRDSGRIVDAATELGREIAGLAVEAIEATGGVAWPCEAAAGSLALFWVTAGAGFEKNCGN